MTTVRVVGHAPCSSSCGCTRWISKTSHSTDLLDAAGASDGGWGRAEAAGPDAEALKRRRRLDVVSAAWSRASWRALEFRCNCSSRVPPRRRLGEAGRCRRWHETRGHGRPRGRDRALGQRASARTGPPRGRRRRGFSRATFVDASLRAAFKSRQTSTRPYSIYTRRRARRARGPRRGDAESRAEGSLGRGAAARTRSGRGASSASRGGARVRRRWSRRARRSRRRRWCSLPRRHRLSRRRRGSRSAAAEAVARRAGRSGQGGPGGRSSPRRRAWTRRTRGERHARARRGIAWGPRASTSAPWLPVADALSKHGPETAGLARAIMRASPTNPEGERDGAEDKGEGVGRSERPRLLDYFFAVFEGTFATRDSHTRALVDIPRPFSLAPFIANSRVAAARPRERGRGGYGRVRHDGGVTRRRRPATAHRPATASAEPPEPVEPKPAAPPAAPDQRSMVLARSFRSCPSVMAHAAWRRLRRRDPPLTPGEKVSTQRPGDAPRVRASGSGASLAPPFSASCARMRNAIIGGRIEHRAHADTPPRSSSPGGTRPGSSPRRTRARRVSCSCVPARVSDGRGPPRGAAPRPPSRHGCFSAHLSSLGCANSLSPIAVPMRARRDRAELNGADDEAPQRRRDGQADARHLSGIARASRGTRRHRVPAQKHQKRRHDAQNNRPTDLTHVAGDARADGHHGDEVVVHERQEHHAEPFGARADQSPAQSRCAKSARAAPPPPTPNNGGGRRVGQRAWFILSASRTPPTVNAPPMPVANASRRRRARSRRRTPRVRSSRSWRCTRRAASWTGRMCTAECGACMPTSPRVRPAISEREMVTGL